jgi:hypothetical protein
MSDHSVHAAPVGPDAPVLAAPAPPAGGNWWRLTNRERRWLLVVLEAAIPSGVDPRIPIGAADVPLGRFVDDLLDAAPLKFVFGLRACLWLVLLAPPFALRRWATFLGLAPAERYALFDRLRESPLYVVREAPVVFKTVGCLGYCGLPHVQRRLGISPTDASPPPWARPDDAAVQEPRA